MRSNHLIQFACFCEVEAIGQMAHSFHLSNEAKEIIKTQILMDKIFTFSRIKHHEISICPKDHYEILVEFLLHS